MVAMGQLLDVQLNFERMECCVCGTVFWMSGSTYRNARENGANFFCPNGHSQSYTKSRVAVLEEQLERERKRREWAEKNQKSAARALTAQRGENTKLRKRIAGGACPCCKRSFQNLARHMKTKHPKFADGE